jgi:Skp family chaperone for outer membrane proteins
MHLYSNELKRRKFIMTFAKTLLILTAIIGFVSMARAQAPAQPAPAKVGIINSEKFAATTGGITRLVNALRTIEAEFKPKRDEINQLASRLDALQQVPAGTTPAQLATRREQAQTLQVEIQRKQEDARIAFSKRGTTLTGPIRLSILNALEAFAKQRSLDVLIDLSKFPEGVLLVNPNADLTAAFVRDFNSKNP